MRRKAVEKWQFPGGLGMLGALHGNLDGSNGSREPRGVEDPICASRRSLSLLRGGGLEWGCTQREGH